ncbi:CHAT domain-containing protein [Streptomyces sp. NPDC090045]|uniref:CHAT domain-containing protein n=1 Tax=Streptomyces sp. NPDC090045 TaxID=3365927 RepID=UPI003826058E
MTATPHPNLTPADFLRFGALSPFCIPLPLPYGPDPAALRVEGAREPGRTWAVAAAALSAGEPRRALAALDAQAGAADAPPGAAAVTTALRVAAQAVELGHAPGGWSTSVGDQQQLMEFMLLIRQGHEPLADAPAGLPRLLTFLAGSLLPEVLSVQRSLSDVAHTDVTHDSVFQQTALIPALEGAADSLATPSPEALEMARLAEDILLRRFAEPDPDHPFSRSAHAALRLLLADLWHRAGARAQAEERLRAALDAAPDDLALQGWAALIEGDWSLGRPGGAEWRLPAEELPAADLDTADRRWEESAGLYRRARCHRGEAGALLRRAYVARLRGSADRGGFLRTAETLAVRAGDGALRSLVQVHSWLDLIEDGADVPDEQCASVREWGVTHGGDGWLRSLSTVLSARATRWSSAGDAVRATQAEYLAAALVGDSAARAARHSVEGAAHDLSEIVLTEEELTGREAELAHAEEHHKGEQPHLVAHLNAMLAAMRFTGAASGLADPDLLTLAADRTQRLAEASPRRRREEPQAPPAATPEGDEAEQLIYDADLAGSPESARAYAAYSRARAAALAGLEERTRTFGEEALDRALACRDVRTALATLLLLRRMDEARFLLDRLAESRALNAWELTYFRLFAGQAQEASQAARGLDQWALAFPGRPWELAGLRAEVAAAIGDHSAALGLVEEALGHYEAHRARLARDALRSSLADDGTVASLYHTGVLSHLSLDGVTGDTAEACEAGIGARAAFALSERARSGFLDGVRALDMAQGPEEERTVRDWLRADSRWSAVYEDQVALLRRRASVGPAAGTTAADRPLPDSAERRRRAEEDLGAAERRVRRAVPAALTAWRGTQHTTVEEVAASLPPGVLLLQYHLFDEDLAAWAVTRERVRVVRRSQWAYAGAGLARRFHSWCSGLGRDTGVGAELAGLLLTPFAEELRDHQQVLLAPTSRMSLLPFQALPWEGGVLADHHTLSYLPAASALTRSPARSAPSAAWSALLVGDPATDPALRLNRIPGTAVEVRHAAALLPAADELCGAEATLDAVATAAAGRGILHLATHGMVDELSPNRNHLVLAGRDGLSVGDLYGLHTHAGPELLVLSGCHTGRGTATSGGDVLGLARSALMAGAHHAVVSLWPVDDRSGALTMIRMYRHLAAARSRLPGGPGSGVAAALAEAQREVRALTAAERDEEYASLAAEADCPVPAGAARGTVRDSGSARAPGLAPEHPFHWAPFVHIGTQEATS